MQQRFKYLFIAKGCTVVPRRLRKELSCNQEASYLKSSTLHKVCVFCVTFPMDCRPQSRRYKNIGKALNPHQKKCFCNARHPESTHTGLHLQRRLYDYQQAYQLYLYRQVTECFSTGNVLKCFVGPCLQYILDRFHNLKFFLVVLFVFEGRRQWTSLSYSVYKRIISSNSKTEFIDYGMVNLEVMFTENVNWCTLI